MASKLFDVSVDIQKRLFWALAGTACIANTIGFISNIIFFGLTGATWFCGFCALLMYIFSVWGTHAKSSMPAAVGILLVINVVEFPFLYYVYGPGRVVYMLLGIVGMIVFLKQKWHVMGTTAIAVYDAAVLVVSALWPCQIVEYSPRGDLGASVASLLIVIGSISMIILLLIMQYEYQNAKLQEMTKELREMADLDPLTKLYNRRYLTGYLDELAARPGASFAIALLDIDDFKQVNDRFGHVYGDDVLCAFAQSMQKRIAGNGIAARFGGEEFMLVFHSIERSRMENIVQQLQSDMDEFSMSTRNEHLSFSGGVEEFHNEDRINFLFNAADEKLYTAKKTGKHKVVFERER